MVALSEAGKEKEIINFEDNKFLASNRATGRRERIEIIWERS